MAGTQQIGLKAVFDLSDFASNVNGYLSGIAKIQSANSGLVSSSGQMGSAVAAGIGASIGTAAVQAIQAFGTALAGLGEEVFQSLKFFEQLQFTLETLFAIQGKNSGQFATVEEGLQKDSEAAQEYMYWLQQLAIFSPFTTEQIAGANTLLQTYGFLADTAAGLTKEIVDFASAAGKGPDQIESIAAAIGRIREQGRLLSRDAQQLIRAGIPIYDFLTQKTGQTTQQLLDLQEKGMLPAKTALEALVEGLHDFDGSGKRVSGTIAGLFSSLQDIKQIATRDLFGGIFEGVRPELQSLVDTLASPDFRAALTVVGEDIGKTFEGIIQGAEAMAGTVTTAIMNLSQPFKDGIVVFFGAAAAITALVGAAGLLSVAITALINPFTLIVGSISLFAALYVTNFAAIQKATDDAASFVERAVTDIGNGFQDLASNVGDALSQASDYIASFATDVSDWGSNIITSLAGGIEEGASAVIDAVNFIGSIVANLMQPGSPPKFLPDLDKWGTEAAQVYLDAWGEASFDAINDFTSKIGGLLKSMAGAGKIPELSVPGITGQARDAFAKAIDQLEKTGAVSEDTFKKVKDAAGPAGDAANDTLHAFIGYFKATKDVTTAQDKLNEVTEKYKKLLTPIREEMDKIAERKQQLSENNEIASLQRLLARNGVSQSLRDEASARIDEINQQRKLRGLEKEGDTAEKTAQDQLDAAKKVQDEAKTQIDIINKRIQVEQDSFQLVEDELRIREQIRKEEERLAKEAERLRREQLEKQLKIAELFQQELKDTVEVFKDQYILADATATAIEKQNAQIGLQAVLGRRIVRDDDAKKLGVPQSELDKLRKVPVTLEDAGIKVKGTIEDIKGSIEGLDKIDFAGPFDKFKESIDHVRDSFDHAKKSLDDFITRVDAALPSFLKLKDEASGTSPALDTLGSILAGLGAGFITSRLISVIGALPALIGSLNPVSATVIATVSVLAAAYAGNWFHIREATATGVQFVQDKVSELAKSDAWKNLKDSVVSAKDSVVGFFTEGGFTDFIQGNAILKQISDTITQSFIPALQQVIAIAGDVFGPIFAPLQQGINIDNIIKVFSNIGDIVVSGLSVLPGIITKVLGDMVKNIQERAPGIAQAFLDFLPTIPTRLLAGLLHITAIFYDFIRTFIPQLEAQALLLGAAFLNWLGPISKQVIVGLGAFVGAVLRWIIGTGVPFLFKAAFYLSAAVLKFIEFMIVDFPPMAAMFIARFVAWLLTEGVPMLIKAGTELANAIMKFNEVLVENVGPALKVFLAAVYNFFVDNIIPALAIAAGEIGQGILQGLYDAFGQENVDPVLEAIKGAFDFVVRVFEAVVSTINAIGNAILFTVNAIGTIMGTLIDLVKPVFSAIGDLFVSFSVQADAVVGTIEDLVGAAITNSSNFITATSNVLLAAWNVTTSTIVSIFNTMVGTIIGTLGSWVATSISVTSTFVADIINIFNPLTSFIDTWGAGLVTLVGSFVTDLYNAALNLGNEIVNGIRDGITNLIDVPKKAIGDLLGGLLGEAQKLIDSNSPSKVYATEVGEPIGAGIGQGISNFDLGGVFNDLIGNAVKIFKGLGEGTGDETKNLTKDGTNQINIFSQDIIDTFTSMQTAVTEGFGTFADNFLTLFDGLTGGLLENFRQYGHDVLTAEQAMETSLISALSTFAGNFAAVMTSVVTQALTSFQALRPAIVAEVDQLATDVITDINTPNTGFVALMGLAFELAGETIGKALADGIVQGFIGQEKNMITSLQESMARVLTTIAGNLSTSVTGASTDVTSSSVDGRFLSLPANMLPGSVSNVSRNNNFNLTVKTEANSQGVIQDYGIMQTMAQGY